MIRRGESKRKAVAVGCIALAILVPAAVGFIAKLIEFIRTLHSEEGGGFTIVPIANYLLITAGFTCLLVWAIANGMFRDVEGPKYEMLEREAELDRLEGREWKEETRGDQVST